MSELLPKEGEPLASGVVVDLIDSGGSAYVYKIYNEELELHRAVKVLNPAAPEEDAQRFQTEARISAKLNHPNIVRCFNVGKSSRGLPFIEMEYLPFPSLATLKKEKGALPVPFCLAVGLCVLDGLDYAHNLKYTLYGSKHAGVIHRDLKPANLVVSEVGEVRIMDFGIAKPVGVSLHTLPDTVPGTLAYMSPEACSGRELDFTSDIYQFGLCVFELLTGTAAFPQTSLTAIISAKAANKISSFSKLDSCDPRAASVIRRCLQLDPKDRYLTARACLKDLRAVYDQILPDTPPAQVISAFMHGQPLEFHPKNPFRFPYKPAFAFMAALLLAGVFWGNRRFFQKSQELPQKPSALPAPVIGQPEPTKTTNQRQAPPKPALPSPGSLSKRAKPQPFSRPTPQKPVIPASDALYFIQTGQTLYSSADYLKARETFQKALKTPSASPRQLIIQQAVFWSAKCNFALFKQGQVPKETCLASWNTVLNLFPVGSPEHKEALSALEAVQ